MLRLIICALKVARVYVRIDQRLEFFMKYVSPIDISEPLVLHYFAHALISHDRVFLEHIRE